MGDNTQLWPWLARLCWMVMLSLTLVYIFHSAPRATPYLAPPQGLAFCLYCGYGLMWHIFLMTVAFPVAMVEGYLALTSHVPRDHVHFPAHLYLNVIALVALVGGTVTVIGSKIFVGREQFSSAHSWVGGLTVALSVGQFLVGITVFRFLKRSLQPETLKKIMEMHRLTGKLVVIGGIMSCVVGWADMQQITGHMGQEPYSSAQMIGSATAVLLTVLLGIVCYLFMLGPLSHHQPHPQPISKLPT